MDRRLRILYVEDSPDDALLVLRTLKQAGYDVQHERVETAQDMRAALSTQKWDIVLSDYSLPQFNAPAALSVMKSTGLDIPFIIISGTIGEDTAVSALKAGAQDFIVKGNTARLVPAIERELRDAEARRARVQMATALQESEDRYRAMFEQTRAIKLVVDSSSFHIVNSNAAACEFFGHSHDELTARKLTDFEVSDSSLLRQQLSRALVDKAEIVSARLQLARSSLRDVEIYPSLIDVAGEKLLHCIMFDVTERRQSTEALRQFTLRLELLHKIDQAIIAEAPVVVIADFALHYFTGVLSIWGASMAVFDRGALEGTVCMRYRDSLDSRGLVRQFNIRDFEADITSLETGETKYVEDMTQQGGLSPPLEVLRAKGLRSYVAIPLMAQGELIGSLNLGSTEPAAFGDELLALVKEVAAQLSISIHQTRLREQVRRHTELLEARVDERTAQLQQAKDRVETILNNSSDAILLVSAEGSIEQGNASFDTLLGYSTDELYGESIVSLAEPDEQVYFEATLHDVIVSRQTRRLELTVSRRDGTWFDADVIVAPIVRRNTPIEDVICSIRDISDRKRIERELRQALEAERELSELKSRFTSMVSHEFRTPLAIIQSSTDLLTRYSERLSLAERNRHLEKIQTQVRQMTDLMNDVLTLGKAQANALQFNPAPVDLDQFCLQVVMEYQSRPDISHTLNYSFAGQSKLVMADEKLIHRAISNLLTNAFKYSPDGSVVELHLSFQQNRAFISVRDNGIGIPEKDQPRLFESFHRASNVGNVEGTGLGLAIVKHAVEAHGGSVTFTTQEDVGTIFTIDVPVNELEID